MNARTWIAVLAGMVAARGVCGRCERDPAPSSARLATFNIENFPKHARQTEAAFDEIAALDASVVGVQEIYEPALLAREAKARLGDTWELVSADTAPTATRYPSHHLGVLFDRATWRHVATRVHDETRLDGRQKPTLEVELATPGGVHVRVLVVHLKAGGDGRAIRHRQYAALASIVREARRSGDRVVLMGDFNATDDRGDRADLAELAATTATSWATEPLACSAFWDRDDGCFRSRLDHVLVSTPATTVEAAGACATEGCERQDTCPLYTREVSDHCPIVIGLPLD
ncbi:MAG TPA: endonuclease/exonuclease/phosphatase family protein [Kofleriaceae bacterium]|nr:endonuclease/exonuclease/phosphatase family protein [Kofleriaceae bacterium]